MLPDMLDTYLPTPAVKAYLIELLRIELAIDEACDYTPSDNATTRAALEWFQAVPTRPV